jgi:hypothetical protein
MVIDIETIRYGAGFDATGHWHEAIDDRPARTEQEKDWVAPVRGAVYGILLSGILWVGLVAAVRGVLSLLR